MCDNIDSRLIYDGIHFRPGTHSLYDAQIDFLGGNPKRQPTVVIGISTTIVGSSDKEGWGQLL